MCPTRRAAKRMSNTTGQEIVNDYDTCDTLLSRASVSPREVAELMRHTDLCQTMKVYTYPRVFDLAGAVEKLPISLTKSDKAQVVQATGTDGEPD